MHIGPEQFFQSLADPTRLRCLMLLQRHGELCVCELTHALEMAQPKVSRHLAVLREAGLVLDRRQGLWVYYAIHPELADWARAVLHDIASGLLAAPPFAGDTAALADMPNRPGARCCA
jgi:ArsR family transcriptional regulator, arsenate/arsenite/antimonite-responsive transcriptional repressor